MRASAGAVVRIRTRTATSDRVCTSLPLRTTACSAAISEAAMGLGTMPKRTKTSLREASARCLDWGTWRTEAPFPRTVFIRSARCVACGFTRRLPNQTHLHADASDRSICLRTSAIGNRGVWLTCSFATTRSSRESCARDAMLLRSPSERFPGDTLTIASVPTPAH
jgi:hypothetical protein